MIEVWVHGMCEPINPGGSMACTSVIRKDGEGLRRISEFWPPHEWMRAGSGTAALPSANLAVYHALVNALGFLFALNLRDEPTVIHANKMVYNQMFGTWTISQGHYAALANECRNILRTWKNVRGEMVAIQQNAEAAQLSLETLIKNGVQPRDWSKKGEADAARNHRA